MANICCSIEMEPRTLNRGQLNNAREIAVDIVQNQEPEAASSIFSEGLKPVTGIKEAVDGMVSDTNLPQKVVEEVSSLREESSMKIQINAESYCQCSCTAIVLESPPDELRVKEPISAPF